eukprot:COSAG01_NODE_4750_length_4766_cov_16.850043_9_plen_116_part_00
MPHRPDQARVLREIESGLGERAFSAEARAKAALLPPQLEDATTLATGLSCARLNAGGVSMGWGCARGLSPPLDGRGFKAPITQESFVTISVRGPAPNCDGVLRLTIRFLLEPEHR